MIPASTRALVLSLPEPARRALAEVPAPGWIVFPNRWGPRLWHRPAREEIVFDRGEAWLPASEAAILDAAAALMGEGWAWEIVRDDGDPAAPYCAILDGPGDSGSHWMGARGAAALDAAVSVFAAAFAAKEGR